MSDEAINSYMARAAAQIRRAKAFLDAGARADAELHTRRAESLLQLAQAARALRAASLFIPSK